MNVVICWSGISGYLAACWRALATLPNIKLRIFVRPSRIPYEKSIVDGLNVTQLTEEALKDPKCLASLIEENGVDVIVISGWSIDSFYQLPFKKSLRQIPFLLAMDTPWRGDLRQHFARLVLHRLVSRMSGVFVSGERGAVYAQKLGFRSSQISISTYGCDYNLFQKVALVRNSASVWPKKFLYVGRYAKEKGLDILLEAYHAYCKRVSDPWGLSCYGAGELRGMLDADSEVEECGFVQPAELPAVFAEHGAFVMPSLYEPWGVALAEAAASGLPVLCSNEVCSSIDMVRHLYNGYVVSPGDACELESGLVWCHENIERLRLIGERGQWYANAYSAEMWADRWLNMINRCVCRKI